MTTKLNGTTTWKTSTTTVDNQLGMETICLPVSQYPMDNYSPWDRIAYLKNDWSPKSFRKI